MTKLWDRDSLYREVWVEPLTTVAIRYGVSGNAIAKVCKKLRIPLPGRGYWAKKAHGYSVQQISLPPMKEVPRLWQPTPKPVQETVPMDSELHLIDQRLTNGDFSPSSTNRERNAPLGEEHKAMRARRKENPEHHRIGFRSDELDLRVSTPCLDRAIELIASIVEVGVRIGASVKTKQKKEQWEKTVTLFAHDGNEVAFCVREKLRMVKSVSSDSSYSRTSHAFEPTGVLAFEILEYVKPAKVLWQDKQNLQIEAQVPEIIAGLLKASILLRRRAEAMKQRDLLARQREIELQRLASRISQEEERVKALIASAENWRLARIMREYLAELEKLDPADQEDANAAYIKWAKEQADRIDPLTPSPPSILDRRKEVKHSGSAWRVEV